MLIFERAMVVCILSSAVLLMASTGVFNRVAPQTKEARSKSDTELIHSVEGSDLYHAYCASCHGKDAHGDGPAASALKSKVPDLTFIAKRNHGNFPAKRVSRIISGEETPAAHGSREMPVWGPIFHQVEADQDWGNVRLQNLARYLESIQKN